MCLPNEQCLLSRLYDVTNARPFEFVARIYLNYYANAKIPVLIVCNNFELPPVRQDYILQSGAFCNKHKLPPRQPISTTKGVKKEVFVKLATMAAFPHFHQLDLVGEDTSLIHIGIALTAIGFFVLKYFQVQQKSRY